MMTDFKNETNACGSSVGYNWDFQKGLLTSETIHDDTVRIACTHVCVYVCNCAYVHLCVYMYVGRSVRLFAGR